MSFGRANNSNIKKKLIAFNIAWLATLIFIFYIYLYVPFVIFFDLFGSRTEWYIRFLVAYIPLFVLEIILHWLVLKYLFPDVRKSHINWVFAMPLLILIGLGLVIFFGYVFSPKPI